MAWHRIGDGRYRYAKIRRDGRVCSVYIPPGPAGEARLSAIRAELAGRAEQRAEERRRRRADREAERAEWAGIDCRLDELDLVADETFRWAMHAAGYHEVRRQWRRAMKPKPLTVRPNMPVGNDIVFAVKSALASRFAKGDMEKQIDAHRMMEQYTAELSGPNPTPTERLLVDRVVVCWFNVYEADLTVEKKLKAFALMPPQFAILERRRTECHRRFLSAVRALERLRAKVSPVRSSTRDISHDRMESMFGRN